uniref:Uncharacterized protein n=2 Tax=Candidatus Kentrum sp. FM TaxID=2126340 RepID=A0A450TXT5_9GAMM|nr:MAG: hypothetical protein BECKFM1743C_GA0114222_106341 [Candidatus Kentron sp. FM]VFJ74230.1 MAG: hypothetical protein BECKFM1743A_GA0114220_107662 [Candidatus Kentron sp. FM]
MFSVLLSVHFLFFLYAFHAAISIRYWFAIDIAIRYRYRSYSIASSDIDSERTTTPGCGLPRCGHSLLILLGRIFLLGEGKPSIRCDERFRVKESPLVGWNRRASRTFG